jgi:aquaporin Z
MADGASGLVGVALAHGLVIAVMFTSLSATSGGHFNPAITVGAYVTKNIDPVNAIGYVLAQCLGAVVAAFLIKCAMPIDPLAAVGLGTPALGSGVTLSQGLITEIVLTFFLMFVIYAVAIERRARKLAGLMIGLTITLGIFMGAPVSGAAMNPARHLGPALMGGGMHDFWLYWIGPIIGASLAALLFKHVLAEKE